MTAPTDPIREALPVAEELRLLAASMRHSAGQWMVPGWDGHKVADLLLKGEAALKAKDAERQWQPIETAPKDVAVLLRVPLQVAKWANALPCMGVWMGSFWAISNADNAVQRVEPSNWMPLPPEPAALKEPS